MGRRVLWMLLVLLLGFIWGHSLQNGTASQAESQSVLHLALARWGNLPGMDCLNYHPETGPSHGICGPGDGPFRVGRTLRETEPLFSTVLGSLCGNRG